MTPASELLLALALGMDTAVLAFALGLAHPGRGLGPGVRLALWFGAFQAGMAVLGWAGLAFLPVSTEVAEKGAALMFVCLGLKVLWDVWGSEEGVGVPRSAPMDHKAHFVLAVATSLDALVAGMGLVVLPRPGWTIALIGVVAGLMTFGGSWLSQRMSKLPEKSAITLAALVFIFLGVKILL